MILTSQSSLASSAVQAGGGDGQGGALWEWESFRRGHRVEPLVSVHSDCCRVNTSPCRAAAEGPPQQPQPSRRRRLPGARSGCCRRPLLPHRPGERASSTRQMSIAAGHCFLPRPVGLHSWPLRIYLPPWNQIYRPGSSRSDLPCPSSPPPPSPLQFHRLVTAVTSIQRAFRAFKQRCLRKGWPSQSITRRLLTQV